jgi:hypothetical protein
VEGTGGKTATPPPTTTELLVLTWTNLAVSCTLSDSGKQSRIPAQPRAAQFE